MNTREIRTGNRTDNDVPYQTPRVEVSETKQAIRLSADMPGVGPNGVSVALDDNVLTLEGTVGKSDGHPARRYRRRFTLSDTGLFDVDTISAKMTNGVLEVQLPKAAKPEPRQIKITAA